MRTVGERLQREREMRGITLEEIAEATKIGTRSLRALELEEFDTLPGGIFNKGFVRAYARFLGIDEEQAVADYMAANRDAELAFAAQQPIVPTTEVPRDTAPAAAGASWRIALLIVLLAAISAGGWYLYNRQRSAPAMTPAEAPAAVQSRPSAIPATLPAERGVERAKSAAASPLPKVAPASTSLPAKLPAEKLPAIVLRIRARSDAWMEATADGKLVLETILKPSDERVVRGEKQVVLNIGNAGGVEISCNGKPVAPLGPEGKARKVTFTPEGMQQ